MQNGPSEPRFAKSVIVNTSSLLGNQNVPVFKVSESTPAGAHLPHVPAAGAEAGHGEWEGCIWCPSGACGFGVCEAGILAVAREG